MDYKMNTPWPHMLQRALALHLQVKYPQVDETTTWEMTGDAIKYIQQWGQWGQK